MISFLRNLFTLVGVVAAAFLVVALWFDLQQMEPNNGGYWKGEVRVLPGEAVSFDNLDATTEGFTKRGFLLDLLLECRSGKLSLEFFKWRLDIGKMSESEVQLHQPQAACKKRGLQTLF